MTKDLGYKAAVFMLGAMTAFLIIYGIPSRLPLENPYLAKAEPTPISEIAEIISTDEKTQTIIAGIEGIQIKASGEDPLDGEYPRDILDLKKEFEKRATYTLGDTDVEDVGGAYDFKVPAGLSDMVGFWVQVFGHYGKGQYLFHNKDSVELFYSVLDLRYLDPDTSGMDPATAEALRNSALIAEKKRIHDYLLGLDQKITRGDLLDAEEQKLALVFAKYPDKTIQEAANLNEIRIQGGFAHRFKQAVVISGLYMKEMERIFREKNLPIELTRLPFVESAFNIKAYSSADAAGLWQFIPETGERYLKIDEIADERLDPIYSTYAAATHLKNEFALIGNWPLTLNAYNTGAGRIRKAMRELNTDNIEKVIREFKEPGYQFYSRNYYPEFLAALHVYENQMHYFGRLNILPPLQYEVYSPNRLINLPDLATVVDMDEETLKNMNPALASDVLLGTKDLPAGYLVRVPPKMGTLLANAETMQREEASSPTQWYVAEAGDTIESIAKTANIPAALLEKINGLLANERLEAGTFIQLPQSENVAQNAQNPVTVVQ